MATSNDSDNKILLLNNNGPPESNRMLFWKDTLTKNISYKENKEKDLINKVKCFTENDNREVWSDRKLLFWFAKDWQWMEIKWLTKFSHLDYLGWQISVISRQKTPSMLVSIGTQYSHLHQVL